MERNNLTIELLDDPPAPESLTIEDLAQLDEALSEDEATVKRRRAAWERLVLSRYGAPAAIDRGEPFGTGHAFDGDYDVTVIVPKNVSWDQDGLREAMDQLEAVGEDPREYMRLKLEVAESAYKAWPASLRKMFEPARTTKPGKTKIEIKRRERRAA